MLTSHPATKARKICVRLYEWIKLPDNVPPLNAFPKQLVTVLCSCLPSTGSAKRHREKMWVAFHKIRLSSDFKTIFVTTAIEVEPTPLLFQHITDKYFLQKSSKFLRKAVAQLLQ